MNKLSLLIIAGLLFGCSDKSATDHLVSAKNHMSNEELSAAAIELKNAIQASPELAEARFLLGKLYMQTHRYESAEKEFSRAMDFGYPVNEVMPLLSLAFQKTGADVALTELAHKQAGLTAEKAVEIAFYKLQAYMRLDKTIKAKAIINDIKGYNTTSPFKGLSLAYSMLIGENNDAALIQIDQVLETAPVHGEALKLKARLLLVLKKPEEAVTVYEKYNKNYPEDLETALILARLLTDINETEKAEVIVNSLMKINDGHMLLNQLKGLARFNIKDYKSALFHTEKAILLNPTDPALRLIAGYSAYILKEYESSHEHLSHIADKLPPTHPALRLLAASQLQLGLHLEANDTLGQIDSLTKDDATLVSSVGLALVKAGELNKAKKLVTLSGKVSESADELTRLGMLKLSLNDVSGIANLEKALVITPQEKMTKATLATAYLSTGQNDKAIALADSWKAGDKKDIQAYMLAGSAYFKAKDYVKSTKEFDQVLSIDNNHTLAQMALVELALVTEQRSEAIKLLDKMLLKEPDFVPALSKYYVIAQEDGNTNNVFKLIKQSLKNNPDRQDTKLLYAKALLNEGYKLKAMELLETIPADEKAPTAYWNMLGKVYFSRGNFNKAEKHFDKWLSFEPNNRSAMLSNLIMLDGRNEFKKALALSSSYVKKRNDDYQMQLLHTHFLVNNGEFESANTIFETLPENIKALPFAKGLLGQLQIKDKNYQPALKNIQVAYDKLPNSRNVQLIYLCLVNLQQHTQAYTFLVNHVETHETDLPSIMRLANLQITRNVDDAISNYQKALLVREDNLVVLNNLAYLYIEKNQLGRAKLYAEKALIIQPNNVDVLDTLGQILAADENYQEALIHLEKAVKVTDVKEEIYLNYVEVLLRDNQIFMAKRKIEQRTLELKPSLERLALLKSKYKLD
ncbi:MAG: PEP-CTERM system TPR-repeat protein PrsT [Alteromonadaceae bacterium]|nr:PEP-CTERM system TPR-repeat protein PrsT [Alteromonadaceae bacterium]